MEKVYQPKKVEQKIYSFWQKSGFFNPDRLPFLPKKSFTIVLPPPNITGELHLGHALNAIVQDILIRKKRMEGFLALWLPGTDHAGIAAQNVVEKELKKEGLSRFDLGKEKFIKKMWEWKRKYGGIILDQLKKLGSSCDWSRTVFTLDKDYSFSVNWAFEQYFKQGWIYRGKRVVNWCKRCKTSLSDLELEHKIRAGKLWYIKYPLKDSKLFVIVATTRPETMLGDMAVAVNPKDQRYKNLIGKKVILPLVNREIPIIADRLVDPKFGTGAVKVTPAHDLADYEIAQRHNLELCQVIDEDGKMIKPSPLAYQGLSTLEAREKIVEDLKKEGLLEKEEDYQLSVPKCYRCQTTIEFIPSFQWFLKMEKLANLAIEAVKKGRVKFIPKRWEKVYFDWLKNIQDWCISRQIWWGHSLPIWQCQINKNSKIDGYFISLKKPKKCLFCKKCQPRQIEDVLDTWFSSALWPFATLGWPKETKDLKRFYPTQILSTDRGIINLWVARMIFSGLYFMKKEPFKEVYIHATVLTKEGKRMSKSLGTGVDPIDLIEKYGADATRFGICWQITGLQDIRFSEEHMVAGKKFCNKLWNATRFLLGQVKKSKVKIKNSKIKITAQNLTGEDKKILKALEKTIKEVNLDLENYRFGPALWKIYHFFWHQFCDRYIEYSKTAKDQKNTSKILILVMLNSIKLLHPFLPFITEEIYQHLPLFKKKKSLMIESWPK